MARVKNTATGQILTIPDDQVPFMSSQWRVVGSDAPVSSATPTFKKETPVKMATVYGPKGATQQVPEDQAAQLLSSGWFKTQAEAAQKDAQDSAQAKAREESQRQSELVKGSTVSGPLRAASPAGITTIYRPNGESMQVMNADVAYWKTQGWNVPASVAPKPADEVNALKAAGIDTAGLNQNQISYLNAFQQMMQNKANQDKAVLPPVLTASDLSKFMDEAKSEIDPYYAERLNIGKKDILDSVADLTQDVAWKEQQRTAQFSEQQKQAAEQMAESGLAFSGIRQEAERKMKESQQGIIHSEASEISRSLRDRAKEFERTYGSKALADLRIPGLSYAGVPISPPQTQGNLLGTETKAETTDLAKRRAQLAQESQAAKYGLAFPQ